MFVSMVKNEGPLSLWKGNGANVVRIMPFAAIELFAFEFYKAQFAKIFNNFNTNNEYRSFFYLVAGGLSGMSASALVLDFDGEIFCQNKFLGISFGLGENTICLSDSYKNI